eukprot:gnl/TRDRNA2_/TRDRNA2_158375_c0_seq2.p2 gnl/TRDRNA2_/TRDRNA2_158375_c0~~gnl/TRDRNA2_/TRDRNA2_158375_c0_seq2.p2  ORF type:complete len:105 (-),score=14.80 gnl/TRDRNA2_/TRDRNA2_158375_c0_seq2:56-370(-)
MHAPRHQNVACSAHRRCPALGAAEKSIADVEGSEGAGATSPLQTDSDAVLAAVTEAARTFPYWGKESFADWVQARPELGLEYINSYQRYYGVSGRREHLRAKKI